MYFPHGRIKKNFPPCFRLAQWAREKAARKDRLRDMKERVRRGSSASAASVETTVQSPTEEDAAGKHQRSASARSRPKDVTFAQPRSNSRRESEASTATAQSVATTPGGGQGEGTFHRSGDKQMLFDDDDVDYGECCAGSSCVLQ